MTEENRRTMTPNIVIFGQTGAGKSSIINMLAGTPVAEESSGANGCTSSNKHYYIPHISGDRYTLWDTPGLNEAEDGTVSSQTAIENLQNIVKDHSINLLIYCIRGRLVDIIRINYELLWKSIRMEKVPIVLVVTGLEGRDDMEDWWRENEKTIKKMKMVFAGHACITSWRGRGGMYEKAYTASAEKVWKLVREHCKREPPKEVDYMTDKVGARSFVGHNIILFGEAGSGKSSLVNMVVGKDVARVSGSAEGCTFKSEAFAATIANTAFNIYDTAGLSEGDHGRVPHWQAIRELYALIRQLDGVSLLIFCMRGTVKNAKANWTLFNKVICGENVPIIAVVTGLETYEDPDDWWKNKSNQDVFKKNGMNPEAVGCVVSFAGRQREHQRLYDDSQAKLRGLITKHHLPQPWSQEKDKWFANIYQESFSTELCFPTRLQLEYSEKMRGKIADFIEEAGMKEEDSKELEVTLLKAEKKLRKRTLWT